MEKGKYGGGGGYNIFIPDNAKGIPLFSIGKANKTIAYQCKNCGFIEIYADKTDKK